VATSTRALRALLLQATHRAMELRHAELLTAFLDFEGVRLTQAQRLPLISALGQAPSDVSPLAWAALAAASGQPGSAEEVISPLPSDASTAGGPGVLSAAMQARGALDAHFCLAARAAAAALRCWWRAAVPNAHAEALAAEAACEDEAHAATAAAVAAAAAGGGTKRPPNKSPKAASEPAALPEAGTSASSTSIITSSNAATTTQPQLLLAHTSSSTKSSWASVAAAEPATAPTGRGSAQARSTPPGAVPLPAPDTPFVDSSWIESLLGTASTQHMAAADGLGGGAGGEGGEWGGEGGKESGDFERRVI
jgi:hypothetical protein